MDERPDFLRAPFGTAGGHGFGAEVPRNSWDLVSPPLRVGKKYHKPSDVKGPGSDSMHFDLARDAAAWGRSGPLP